MLTSLASRSMLILLFLTLSWATSMPSVAVSQTTKERVIAPPRLQDSLRHRLAPQDHAVLMDGGQGHAAAHSGKITRLEEESKHLDALAGSPENSSRTSPARGRSEQPVFQESELIEAAQLRERANELFHKGQFVAAIPLVIRALAILEKVLGAKHPAVASTLSDLAHLYEANVNYAQAEQLYLRALAIVEKKPGEKRRNLGMALVNLAGLYDAKGDSARAEPLFQRGLAILEKALGTENPEFAQQLNNFALLYRNTGDFAQAETILQRARTILEKTFGAEHEVVATTLDNLAGVYMDKGDYSQAEQLYRRALTIREKSLDAEHPAIAATLNNLARLQYQVKGDIVGAELLFKRAVEILEKELGAEHPLVAVSLSNLAILYNDRGDYARAESLHRRARLIVEKAFGAEHPMVAITLDSLAVQYMRKDDYAQAEPLFQRALEILEKTLGAEHPLTAGTLNKLATLYRFKGDYERAEPLHQRALAIIEKVGGAEHHDVVSALQGLALLYQAKGDYARAEPLLQRTRAIVEKTGGENHPDVALVLSDLATLSEASGNTAQALRFRTRATEISEHQLVLILTTGSENQKRLYLATLSGEINTNISLHLRSAPTSEEAARLALITLLRRKGRALDAVTGQIASLRRRLNPQDRALLDQLAAVRAQLAALVLKGVGKTDPAQYRAKIARLEGEGEQLEAQVSARSAEFRTQVQPATLERVQQAIPDNAALVEMVLYTPFNARARTPGERFGHARYAAYVLRRGGAPAFVDLGEAAPIDSAVARLRMALGKSQSTDFRRAGRELDELVMRPVRKLLGGARMLLLSPDGALNLVPFSALVDEEGRYLVENYTINYLTSGRDLLRLATETESRQQPIVMANPDFDLAVTASSQDAPEADAARGLRSFDFTTLQIKSLPGTAQEATAIKGIIPNAQVLTERAATESALKQVKGPRLLHIATHGFFLKDQPLQESGTARQLVMGEAKEAVRGENPLLRSGLVLAGVKNGQSGAGEDGVLTALEVSGLDLWGTKLVVLSACETGVGDVDNGEGVYGLRRSLVLAGAESQLMSLWQVNDTATRDLMVDYYRRIERGEGRAEALRAAQLGMLAGKKQGTVRQRNGAQANSFSVDYSHPYYWASFIPIGDWRSMNKTAQPIVVAPSQPVTLSKQPAAPPRPTIAPKPTEKQNDIEALTRMGDARYAQGDFAGAAALYKRSLALRPGNADVFIKLGDTYLHQPLPDYESAIAEYRRALMLNLRHEKAWSGIAAAAIGMKRVLIARDAIDRLAEINPSNSELVKLRLALAALR